MNQKGSCLCGGVKFTVKNDFKATMNCHCQFCRKAHSAPYVTATLMPLDDLVIDQGEEHISEFDIDGIRKRRFCANCGTRIYNVTMVPNFITFMVATLDDPNIAKPVGHVNLESKLESLEINDNLRKFSKFPTKEEVAKLMVI